MDKLTPGSLVLNFKNKILGYTDVLSPCCQSLYFITVQGQHTHGGDSRVGPGREALLGGPPRQPSAHLVCGELRKVITEYIPIQMQTCPRTIKYLVFLLIWTGINIWILQVLMRKLKTHAYAASPD